MTLFSSVSCLVANTPIAGENPLLKLHPVILDGLISETVPALMKDSWNLGSYWEV